MAGEARPEREEARPEREEARLNVCVAEGEARLEIEKDVRGSC